MASIVDCTFASNVIASQDEGVIQGGSDSYIMLSRPIFSHNVGTGHLLLGNHGAMGEEASDLSTFFSDDGAVLSRWHSLGFHSGPRPRIF